MLRAVFAVALAGHAVADVYMHMMRGSNNRLNEKSANRNNGNRLFDSQNNNRGGYNKGDYDDTAAAADGSGQYSELFLEGSKIPVEWTNQHGCGGNENTDAHKLNCNLMLQYVCDTKDTTDFFEKVVLVDGGNTQTSDATNTLAQLNTQKTQNDNNNRGRHESENAYYMCQHRHRNKGLFTADQKLKGDATKYTRQNPNGNRNGQECPEERDYYPYWHPTPWVDVAYLTDTVEDCTAAEEGEQSMNIEGNSMNNNNKYKCVHTSFQDGASDLNANKEAAVKLAFNARSEEECTKAAGVWKTFNHGVGKVDCKQGAWSRTNHLGNGRGGQANTYNWTLPMIDSMSKYTNVDSGTARCVLRLRYNISTDDYDPRTTNSSRNEEGGVISPVEQNPTININSFDLYGLRLAINTAQFGRTFQDRSHVFYIKARPDGTLKRGDILNLNVRGKRGNIVQTFPSVEYDFTPNQLHIQPGSMLHVQWTGSNTHNNGNPAGDGQAGDAGEGTGGTDRSNIVSLTCQGCNYPAHLKHDWDVIEKVEQGAQPHDELKQLFQNDNFDCYLPKDTSSDYFKNSLDIKKVTQEECALHMATSGYFSKVAKVANQEDLNPLLNNAYASLVGGVFLKARKVGTYHYMSTRNNNFSNRSQKGTIVVQTNVPATPNTDLL